MKHNTKVLTEKALPFILTLIVVAADQLSKAYIARNWPVSEAGGVMIRDVFGNDILHIIHVRNKAIAFSLGAGLPDVFKLVLFIAGPVIVLVLLVFYYFKSAEWTKLQRWALAGILGGGIGNIIDRVYPRGGVPGVVDFISVKFWGIFGFERWPTFNIADATIVVCVVLLFATMLLPVRKGAARQ